MTGTAPAAIGMTAAAPCASPSPSLPLSVTHTTSGDNDSSSSDDDGLTTYSDSDHHATEEDSLGESEIMAALQLLNPPNLPALPLLATEKRSTSAPRTIIAYTSTSLKPSADYPLQHHVLAATHRQLGIAHRVWDASSILCSYIEQYLMSHNEQSIVNKRVLELGSGCGPCGILAAKLGAQHVTLTDIGSIVPHMQQNITLNEPYNSAATTIEALELDWLADSLPAIIAKQRYDIILASDCLYWEHLFDGLLHTLKQLFDNNPTAVVYLCQTPRRQRVESRFFKTLRKQRFAVSVMHQQKLKATDRQFVTVYSIQRRR